MTPNTYRYYRPYSRVRYTTLNQTCHKKRHQISAYLFIDNWINMDSFKSIYQIIFIYFFKTYRVKLYLSNQMEV